MDGDGFVVGADAAEGLAAGVEEPPEGLEAGAGEGAGLEPPEGLEAGAGEGAGLEPPEGLEAGADAGLAAGVGLAAPLEPYGSAAPPLDGRAEPPPNIALPNALNAPGR